MGQGPSRTHPALMLSVLHTASSTGRYPLVTRAIAGWDGQPRISSLSLHVMIEVWMWDKARGHVRCPGCHKRLYWRKGERPVIYHIVGLAHGGHSVPDNLVYTCHSCSKREAVLDLVQWEKLLKQRRVD